MDCDGDAHLDAEVTFTPPGRAELPISADICYCSASQAGYDMQLCRADITGALGDLTGEYAVAELDALIENGDTNNASFALVLVYQTAAVIPRRISLYDGLLALSDAGTKTATVTLDAGVDIDRFSLAPILEPGDDTLEITYSAGVDKYWIAFNIVGVDVFQALYSVASQISWALTDDAGGDGEPSPGDTVTFTIHVENSGNAPGMVAITNEIPAEAASWQLVDAGGGDDASDADTLVVDGLALGAGESADVVFSLVIDEVPDQTVIVDMAALDGGAAGTVDLVAPEVLVRRDGDADAVFDADDNCPEDSNPDQADADDDGVGDACDGGGEVDTDVSTDATSGDDSSGGGSGPVTSAPTSGGTPGSADDGDADGDSSSDSEASETAGITSGELDDEGCGCRSDAPPAGALLLLGLLGLRRRRR